MAAALVLLLGLQAFTGYGSVSPTTALGNALPVPGASTPGVAVSSGSAATTAEAATASSGLSVPTSPKPQEKGSVPDWAIVLITLSLVAAIVSLLYGIKKACEFRKEMNMGCGCGSVTPYGCHHEATSQRYSGK
uniref:Uncharacterized protein n=1 Tax=Rangifer tarandus platyrhynchus TaxID=3082113 RepID=A0ACB0EUK7_RANTA|nr:unnamed protein product [Rangifer tarandus platyrhynchus]